ncbi:MAG: ABC transporter permease [Caldilineaceae bacterium]|nr:ABC transporter permease [Caldilineaceae bacterium]
MLGFILRRTLYMLVVLFVIALISFAIIELPPGDYLTSYIARLKQTGGGTVTADQVAALRHQYGLDLPVYARFLKWLWNAMQGDLGWSFQFNEPVAKLVGQRLGMTLVISISTVIFSYALAIPIGIYSAVNQYSLGDYLLTVVGFMGVAVPNFLLALLVMVALFNWFGLSMGGLFSPQYANAPWGWAKFMDLLKHLPAPVLIISLANLTWLIRIMRGTLLDELNKPYVEAARARGLTERQLLFKYPARIALNPIISTIGYVLPGVFSGATIVSIVLNLPTVGPLLFGALVSQDNYLAGSIVLILSALTVLGTLLSDILLAYIDPRIRLLEGES